MAKLGAQCWIAGPPRRMIFRIGDLELDSLRRELTRHGQAIAVQPKVLELLLYLFERRHRAASKAELLEALWPNTHVTESSLLRVVSIARRVLSRCAGADSALETVRGYGYRVSSIAPLQALPNDGPSAVAPRRSLAVLPFGLMGEGPPANGLHLSSVLISRLERHGAFDIRSLKDISAPLDGIEDPIAAGRQQQVDFAIDGRLDCGTMATKLLIRILDVPGGVALREAHFETRGDHVDRLLDRAFREIVQTLDPGEKADGGRGDAAFEPGLNLQAHGHFVRGWLALAQMSPDSSAQAIRHFDHATVVDPSFARAYSGIASAHLDLATAGVRPAESFDAAERAISRALAIDPDEASAHALRGRISWQWDWDWKATEAHFEQALAADSRHAEVWALIAGYQTFVGLAEESIQSSSRACDLSPTSSYTGMMRLQALYFGGRYSEAIDAAKQLLQMMPAFGFAHFYVGLASVERGNLVEGIASLEEAWRHSGRSDFGAMLAYAYARAGRLDEAKPLFDRLVSLAQRREATVLAPILYELVMGTIDRALDHLEKAIDLHDWHALIFASEPSLAPLRAHPRGIKLLDRLGLLGRRAA